MPDGDLTVNWAFMRNGLLWMQVNPVQVCHTSMMLVARGHTSVQ